MKPIMAVIADPRADQFCYAAMTGCSGRGIGSEGTVGTIARDSLTAWTSLKALGGLELDDRDADFESQLRMQLAPSAATLEEALQQNSTDQLVRALLDLVHPFVDMFRAILDFFKAASANQGREQWQIAIEEEHLGLREFEAFFETWNRFEAAIEVPAVDFDGAWALLRAWRDNLEIEGSTLDFLRDGRAASFTGIAEVDLWLAAYARGDYRPFPDALLPSRVPIELADAAGIAWAANETVRSIWSSREAMLADYRQPGFRTGLEEGLSPPTIAQNETDFWLGSSIVLLARGLSLPEHSLELLGSQLQAAYAPYLRRRVGFSADMPMLERILSLPVWKRRHELYAIWIATEMVNALHGHDCELHHEDGRITFAFRETVVATIRSADPEKRIVAERRVPLKDPIGSGRTANVQPDYGIWTGREGAETCGLIVEVKHYKRAARGRFHEVIVDYARAHPQGIILLVNHGPVGDMVADLDEDIRRRSQMLGELTPRNVKRREDFKKLIRDYVGEPKKQPQAPSAGQGSTVLIDVSGSMTTPLDGEEFEALLHSLARSGVATVTLADDRIREQCSAGEAVARARAADKGKATDLAGPIRELLSDYRHIVVITDSDGAAGLRNLAEHVGSGPFGGDGLWLVEIGQP